MCSSWLRHWGKSDMQRNGNSSSIRGWKLYFKNLPLSFALYQCSCFQFHPQSIPLDHNFPKGCQMPSESHSFLWSQYHYWKWKYSWLWKEIQSLSSLFECRLSLPSATEKGGRSHYSIFHSFFFTWTYFFSRFDCLKNWLQVISGLCFSYSILDVQCCLGCLHSACQCRRR